MTIHFQRNTRYTNWEDRKELEAKGIEYFRIGRFAIEKRELEDDIIARRDLKRLLIGQDESGAAIDEKNSNDKSISAKKAMQFGTDGDDLITSKSSKGVTIASLGDGIDQFYGSKGVDIVHLGDSFFNFAKCNNGDDIIIGGKGMDFVDGDSGNDKVYGGGGHDSVYLGSGDDYAEGGDGNDWLVGWTGNDILLGGDGNDQLQGQGDDDYLDGGEGEDRLFGDEGNDTLVFRSDAGTPLSKLDDLSTLKEKGEWNDTAVGGAGADTFHFIYEMDAPEHILAKNADANGKINWMKVMAENKNAHDHWVNWGGVDIVKDYKKGEDKIIIEGHTVGVKINHIDTNKDKKADTTEIIVFSDQAKMVANMRGVDVKDLPSDLKMAHDRDLLGKIVVKNAIVKKGDIELKASSGAAVTDFLYESGPEFNEAVSYFDDVLGL